MKDLANLRAPLFHLIETENSQYIYDTATSQIIQISTELCAYLRQEQFSGAELIFLEQFSSENEGVLKPIRAERLLPILDEDNVQHAILQDCRQIILEVSQSCNLRCRYCIYSGLYEGRRIHTQRLMDQAIARKAIDYLAGHSSHAPYRVVSFYGGEPLCNFKLIREATRYALEVLPPDNLTFSVTTNGTMVNENMIQFFLEHRFHIFISIDGPKSLHDKMRVYSNGKGSFDTVFKTILALRSQCPEYFRSNVHFSMVVSPGTDLGELDEFVEAMCPASVKVMTISDYGTCYEGEYARNPIRNGRQIVAKWAAAACEGHLGSEVDSPEMLLASAICKDPLVRLIKRQAPVDPADYKVGFGICVPSGLKIFVDCDGDIYPCEKTEGSENLLLGNITRDGVRTEKVRQIIHEFYAFMNEFCRDCWLNRLCPACYLHPTWGDKYEASKLGHSCRAMRERYEEVLQLYCRTLERNPHAFDRFVETQTSLDM